MIHKNPKIDYSKNREIPPLSKKRTIVLDIDETILHSTYEKLSVEPDFYFKERKVYLRPNLHYFLNFCFAHFNVGIWTSAKSDYAKFILKKIVPDLSQFEFIWTRKMCKKTYKKIGKWEQEAYIKDLYLLNTQSINPYIVIEDTPANILPKDAKIIVAIEFRGDPEDDELLKIVHELSNILSDK